MADAQSDRPLGYVRVARDGDGWALDDSDLNIRRLTEACNDPSKTNPRPARSGSSSGASGSTGSSSAGSSSGSSSSPSVHASYEQTRSAMRGVWADWSRAEQAAICDMVHTHGVESAAASITSDWNPRPEPVAVREFLRNRC